MQLPVEDGELVRLDAVLAHAAEAQPQRKMEHVGVSAVISFDKRHDLVWAVGKSAGLGVQWQDGKKVAFWPPMVKGVQPFKLPTR